jgi:hypothetical protein
MRAAKTNLNDIMKHAIKTDLFGRDATANANQSST